MMKRIKEYFKSPNAAYFFFCYYLCQLSLCVWLICFELIEVGTDIGGTLLAFGMIIVSVDGLSSAVRYFSKPKIGYREVVAFIGAPLFIVIYLFVITNVFVQTAIMLYAGFVERGIV